MSGTSPPLTTRGHSLALAEEPDCSGYPGGVVGSWCKVRLVYMATGRDNPCVEITGREGHNCRISEIEAYNDPVNNPLEGDFTS